MNRSLAILLSILVAGVVGFSQSGCTVRYVSYQEPAPPPYPSAYRIQGRAYNQIDRIENAVRLGNLDPRVGDALADNDDSVLELVRYFQEASYPVQDLSPREALFLDGMLDDNTVLVDEAIRRRHVWNNYFSGSYAFNFNTSFDRRIYVVYSSYQLKCQQNDIDAAYNAGRLSRIQADEMRDRVRYIRNQRLGACRQSGQWKMDAAQVGQVRLLTEDNSKLFKFRSTGGAGVWTKDKSKQWSRPETAQKATYIKDSQWNPARTRSAKPEGQKVWDKKVNSSNQRPSDPVPSVKVEPTPTPFVAPAQVEKVQEERGRPSDFRDRSKRKTQRRLQQEPPTSPETTSAVSESVQNESPAAVEQDQEAVDVQPKIRPGDFKARQQERLQRTQKTRRTERGRPSEENVEKAEEPTKDSKPVVSETPEPSSEDHGDKGDKDKRRRGRPGFGHQNQDEGK